MAVLEVAVPVGPAARAADRRLQEKHIRTLKDQIRQTQLDAKAASLERKLRATEAGVRRLRA